MKKAAKYTIVSNPFINNITNTYILLHILAQYIISLLDALLYADTVLITRSSNEECTSLFLRASNLMRKTDM